MILELLRGAALLLALSLFQGLISRVWREKTLTGQCLSGLLFGGLAALGMAYPLVLQDGVIFDARAVVLSMSAFFYGPLAGLVAGAVAAGYRFWAGGIGLYSGLGSIATFVALGLVYRALQRRFAWQQNIFHYLFIGLLAQCIGLFWYAMLPAEIARAALQQVAPLGILIFTPASALLGLLLQDVRRNIETADALKLSEQRFRTLYNQSPVLMQALDREGKIRDVNDLWLDRLGYRRKEVIGRYFTDFLSPESRTLAETEILPAFRAQGSCQEVAYCLRKQNGERLDVLLTAISETDPAGAIIGSHEVLADVTERRLAEAALKGSEARYERIFNLTEAAILEQDFSRIVSALTRLREQGVTDLKAYLGGNPDMLAVLAHQLQTLDVNHTAVELFDACSKEDLIGGLEQTVATSPEDYFLPELLAFWNGDEFYRAECDMRTLKGDPLKVIVSLPIPRTILQARDVPVIIVDITAQKQTEQALRRSQKLEAIGQLTGGVAHDFNNLLAVMIGNVELLDEQLSDNSQAVVALDRLKRAIDRGASLTQRLLAFSRQQPLVPQSTDLVALTNGLADMLSRTLGETVSLKISAEADLWPAMVDAHQLEHALVNLVLNARDAMPDGGELTIGLGNSRLDEAAAKEKDEVLAGDYVLLSVTDSGKGMAPEVQAEAFTPFFTTKDVGEGSGLGLSMVYGLVKQSRGHAQLISELGKGTCVQLFLPRAEALPLEAQAPRPCKPFAQNRGHILVVEDDLQVRAISVACLGKAGYEISEATNGEEALRLLADKGSIDLLFTDVVLPGGMNGAVLAARATELLPDIKVLFTTGYSDQAVIRGGRLSPDKGLISKPYRRRDLLHAVRKALGEDAPAQDAPTQDAPAQDAPTQDAPTQDAPTRDAPARDGPIGSDPA